MSGAKIAEIVISSIGFGIVIGAWLQSVVH